MSTPIPLPPPVTLGVVRTAKSTATRARLIIKTKNNGIVFSAPFAPKEVTYGGYENVYQEVTRPDRKPLLRRSGRTLRTISMEIYVGSTNPETSVNEQLRNLERLAESNQPLVIEYDPRTYGNWHITTLSYSSMDRASVGKAITRAMVTIDFTEVAGPTAVTINYVGTNKRPKSIKVKKGQTLQQIVKKYYGTNNKNIIKAVARANNIKNPKHIKPGQKIKLP